MREMRAALALPVVLAAVAPAPASAAPAGHRVGFEHTRAVKTRPAVRIAVGETSCHLPVRVAIVRETRRTVRIELVGQDLPPDAICAQVLQLGCVEVPLRRRLGGRKVVDVTRRGGGVGDEAQARRIMAGRCVRVPRRAG
jgi:hypothetical protein